MNIELCETIRDAKERKKAIAFMRADLRKRLKEDPPPSASFDFDAIDIVLGVE